MYSILVGWLFSFCAYAGTEVNNGGGTAEQNILYAYVNLEKMVSMCLPSRFCELDRTQEINLAKIGAAIPQELLSKDQIQFKSEKKNPGFFIVDGVERVAVTGSTIGSQIFINLDLIYSQGPGFTTVAMDIPSAAAMLVHEIGHHVGLSNDLVGLDLIGAKVKSFLLGRSQKIYHSSDSFFKITATAITFDDAKFGKRSELLFGDGRSIVDATKFLRAEIQNANLCSSLSDSTKADFTIDNIIWSRKRPPYDSGREGMGLRGRLVIRCPRITEIEIRTTYDVEVKIATSPWYKNEKVIDSSRPPMVRLVNCERESCY